jgi:hypothetical protein
MFLRYLTHPPGAGEEGLRTEAAEKKLIPRSRKQPGASSTAYHYGFEFKVLLITTGLERRMEAD